MKIKKGFSLIELIVTITIIAVVTVVTTISFSSTNRKSRDSRRSADLEKIRIGLEMARQVGSTYPATLDVLVTNSYMAELPKDPKTGTSDSYVYSRTVSNYEYTLQATMEDLGSTNLTGMIYQVRNP